MFRTELPLTPHPQQLPLSARVLTIGSCFSDSMGARLAAGKVQTLVNPFGTVFNPLSACRLLRAAAGEEQDWQQHVVEARGRWQSYDLHGSFGADTPVQLLQQLQQLLRDTGVFLATADVVVLTLGTAWAYRLKESGELVSNCHKVAADKFDRELLTPDEIINAVAETHAYLRLRNPKLRFVLTVSPVRHLKDTLPLNAVSKSVLRVACHYLSELLPDVSYFPAYELLVDDLRDYRFYAEDMLHPSKVAEDYIWERFARTYFDAGFGRFRKEWEAVRQALGHRPLYPAAPEHRQFLESTLEKLERLAGQADMRMEILEVRRQLESLPPPRPVLPEPEDDDDEERIDIGEYATPAAAPVTAEAEEEEEFEKFESVSAEAVPYEAAEQAPVSAETEAAELLDTLAPKKKRRSRGGAKRNKKKHAARLAAEAAALAAGESVTVALPGPEAAEPTPEPAPAVPDDGASPLPPVPAAVVTASSEMPLQTALERRKRNSRRGRGRRPEAADLPAPEATPTDAAEQPASAAPEPAEPQAAAQRPADTAAEAAPAQPATEPAPEPDQKAGGRRPERTGRSASEKRAAALRKPHRPGSRIKSLYATDAAGPEAAPESAETTMPASPVPPPAPEAQAAPAPEPAPAALAPAATSTHAPVAPAIPDTKGTGASGSLSASGKATRSARPRPAKTEAAPVAPATPAPASAPDMAPAPAEPAAEAPAPAKKPRRATPRKPAADAAPAQAATDAAALPAEADTPAQPAPAKAKAPKKTPATRKPRATPKADAPAAPAEATPEVVSPAEAPAPAKPRRKSTKAAATPAAEEPAAPKKPATKRAPRRKPPQPDTSSEQS